MTEVARRHAPGLLAAGALSGAALGYLVSQLVMPHEATGLTMGGATVGLFLGVLLDALCSRYHVAYVLPWGARIGCLGAGVSTMLLVTTPSITAAWMSGRNSSLIHFALAAEPHLVLLLVVSLSGAIAGAFAAATSAARGGRSAARRTLVISLAGYTLGLLLCDFVRSIEFVVGGAATGAEISVLLLVWLAYLDHYTLATLGVAWLATIGCWAIGGPWWRRSVTQKNQEAEGRTAAPLTATEADAPQSREELPDEAARQSRKAAILARMSSRAAEADDHWQQ
jgi:hypothetical protein